MATFLLTAGDDTFTGTASDDVFDGYPNGATGGIDKLNGGGGNDLFQIDGSSKGTIDGGAGIDTVELYGSDLGATTYTRVEVLSLVNSSWGVSGSIAQFRAFGSIDFSGDNLMVHLGDGGSVLDFSTLFGAGQSVEVTAGFRWGGYTITGTSNGDTLIGTTYGDTLNGGGGDDVINGSGGRKNILNGGDGDDEIHAQLLDIVDGGAGSDEIYLGRFESSASGGAGNDTFHLEDFVGTPTSFNFNLDGGSGQDTLLIGVDLSSGTFSNIETLITNTGVVRGTIVQINSFERVEHTSEESRLTFALRGAGGVLDLSTLLEPDQSAYVYDIEMSAGYTVTGTANADTLYGTAYADVLNGGAGNDYIDGDVGGDILNGGDGNDEIHGQGSVVADGGNGHDTIYLDNFEGSASGGAGNDIFDLRYPAADPFEIDGGIGNDRLITRGPLGMGSFSNIETLEIFSDSVDSSIEQLKAFARIECLLPYSRLTFGLRGEGGVFDFSAVFGAGSQSVYVTDKDMSGGYTITGTAKGDVLFGTSYADVLNGGHGNDYINGSDGRDILSGVAGDDYIVGGDGNDELSGGAGNDELFGSDGDDRLIGGTGIDAMSGGTGNDTYYVDATGDVIIEFAGEGTADRVATSVSYALTAGAEVELLQTSAVAGTSALNLYGNEFAQTLFGNAGNNVLDGRGGADTMRGLAGNDTYIVDNSGDVVIEASGQGTDDRVIASVSYQLSSGANIERMQTANAASTDAINLIGNNVKQSLFGNAGGNVLDGRGGADTMNGGAGNDTYYVDNSGDVVIEGVGKGIDKVIAATTYTLAANAEIEQMQTISGGATNALNLTGNNFVQTLTGNSGNNRLDGKGGADVMNGSFGDDIYFVDNAGDVVIEAAGRGSDRVIASVSYALTANADVELLQTSSAVLTTKIDFTGSNIAQTILGNSGANRLDGLGGSDTLRGYGGADTFVFSTKLNSANVDTIADFNVAQDTIELESAVFTGLTEGAFISANQFAANTSGVATTVDQRIVYETDTGNFYFDANGSAAGGRVLFGIVSTNLALTSDDFFVG